MSKIKNCGLDQYGAEPFEQQQFGTAGVEGVHLLAAVFYSSLTAKSRQLSLTVSRAPQSQDKSYRQWTRLTYLGGTLSTEVHIDAQVN